MDSATFTQSPFAALTLIAAPALLTNSSSVLALSTINRMLRTRDRMKELFEEFRRGNHSAPEARRLLEQVDRVEQQALLLLRALLSIYVALGAFISATLISLLGAGLAPVWGTRWFHGLAALGLGLGFLGVGGLVLGCCYLFRSTRLSVISVQQEAALVRAWPREQSS